MARSLLLDYLEADVAMRALGDEVSLHDALYSAWHKPMPIAISEIARYAGVEIDPAWSAVSVFTRLTEALRVKRCQR